MNNLIRNFIILSAIIVPSIIAGCSKMGIGFSPTPFSTFTCVIRGNDGCDDNPETMTHEYTIDNIIATSSADACAKAEAKAEAYGVEYPLRVGCKTAIMYDALDGGGNFLEAGAPEAGTSAADSGVPPVLDSTLTGPACMAVSDVCQSISEVVQPSLLDNACGLCLVQCCTEFEAAYMANPKVVTTEPAAAIADLGCWLDEEQCSSSQDQLSEAFMVCATERGCTGPCGTPQ